MNRKEIEEFAGMKKDITYIKESLDENTNQHKELKVMIEGFIGSADGKYASKNVEKIIYWGAGIVGSTIIVALLRLIII